MSVKLQIISEFLFNEGHQQQECQGRVESLKGSRKSEKTVLEYCSNLIDTG